MSEFNVIHNISSDRFCSIAYCYKNTIDYIEDSSIPAVTLLSVKKNSFCPNTINILLVYRKNSLKLDDFIYTINHFLSQTENNIQLILGDFNYNAFREDSSREKLSEVLADYNQIVDQPTHISESLIDHVYINIYVYIYVLYIYIRFYIPNLIFMLKILAMVHHNTNT